MHAAQVKRQRQGHLVDHIGSEETEQVVEVGHDLASAGPNIRATRPLFVDKADQPVAEMWRGLDLLGELPGPCVGAGDQDITEVSSLAPDPPESAPQHEPESDGGRGAGGEEDPEEPGFAIDELDLE